MQVKGFILTLGLGMVAGGMAALMLPQQSQMRKTAQRAADKLEQSAAQMMQ